MHVLLLLLFLFASCGSDDSGNSNAPSVEEEDLQLEVLLNRSDVIWGFDFLPDNKIIFTERSGNLLTWDPASNQTTTIQGLPAISSSGESGLLDLELHPNFASNNLLYFCYSEPLAGGRTIAMGRAELQGNNLVNFQRIFSANSPNNSNIHFGCRVEFAGDGKVFLSLGEQNNPDEAQNPNSFLGKIVRMNDDGSALEIWSSGHRNVQGLSIRPGTNDLFAVEHGPIGGDEFNLIQAGNNYGWPLVTLGEPQGSLGRSAPGFVDPISSWTPAIAPSGTTFFQGDFYIACLRGMHIRRLVLEGSNVTRQEVLFDNENFRYRNVRPGPDGFLYFSTDSGEIGRLVPK